jgi:hypothetical protein
MASLPQQTSSSVAGDDRNLVVVDENYLAPSFEDRVRIFWERHGRTVITALVLVVIFFASKSLFGVYAAHRENAVRAAYAEAGDDIAALRSFATAHPSAALAGVAWARVADDAYKSGAFIAAAEAYGIAAPLLKADPIGARVRMGQAISLLQANDTGAVAVAALEVLANDTAFPAPLRAEAAYHLGVISNEAGRAAETSRWLSLAVSVDTSGLWAQRASRLIERLPPAVSPAAAKDASATSAEDVPAVSFPAATK